MDLRSAFLRVVAAGIFLAAIASLQPAEAGCTGTATATCDNLGNPYAAGLTYNSVNQTLTLGTGVAINSGTNLAVWLRGSGTQTLEMASGVTITNSGSNDAVLVLGSSTAVASSIVINAAGTTVTTNGTEAWGYDIWGTGSIQATVGTVTANANGGVPVYMTSSGGPVSITTGDIKATGDNTTDYVVYGVFGRSTGTGNVTIDTTGGDVTLTGTTTGSGVYGYSIGGGLNIKTGDVSVAGNSENILRPASGVYALSGGAGAAGSIIVDTSAGAVTLTGTSSAHGVYAENAAGAGGGPISVTTANVSTKAANASGIYAQSKATGILGAVTVDSTAGLVKTEGAGATGIFASNTAASDGGLVTVHAGDVTTTGTSAAYGIRATSTSGAVTVTADDISTKGDAAYGVYASGTGAVSVTTGDVTTAGIAAHGIQPVTSAGKVTVDSTAGKITTTGKNSRGVNVDKLSGEVTVDAGAVQTGGDNATGIHVYNGTFGGDGTGGAMKVTANSVVTTGQTVVGNSTHYEVGNAADGIDVFNVGAGEAGKITIDTSEGAVEGTLGTVNVAGRKARGIVAVSGRLVDGGGDNADIPTGGGAIDIKTGTVTTTGDFGTAISAANYGTGANGAITITALGAVSASGANDMTVTGIEREGNYQPNGISAFSWGGGDVTITTKAVSSVGEAAPAITAQSGNGDDYAGIGKVTIDATGGTVSAKGAGSSGIEVGNSSGVVKITTANVLTEGDFANAIQAGNTGPNSAMTIDTTAGKITTAGKNSTGISAGTGTSERKNAGLLKITTDDVETQGDGAVGIGAAAYDGAIEIEVKGDLTTGLLGGDGVQASANGTTTAKVTITGSIVTQAAAADGLQISGIGSANSSIVIVDGEISAAGANASGVLSATGNDDITVNADGVVSGGRAGIRLEQRGVAKVTNKGSITGTGGTAVQFLDNYASTFDNDGTVSGNVLLGDGADTAILRSNSAITGNVNGEAGADELQLAGIGTASLDASTILNFDSGKKIDAGTWTLTGTNNSFMSDFAVNAGRLAVNGTLSGTAFSVASGAVLGGGGTTGAVMVAAGGTLAPGNSIGTLNVASATFAANAIYEVEINGTTSDQLIVAGTATIDGAAQVSVLPELATYTNEHRYLILTADTRTGAFSDTVIENSAFLDFTLDQTIPNEVWLTIHMVAELPDVAETPNQMAAATGIDEIGPGTPVFDAIVPLDADSARRAFDLTSGEIHATGQGVAVEDARFLRESVLARLNDAFAVGSGGSGSDPAIISVGGWGHAYGSRADWDGDGNAAAASRGLGGLVAGIDVGDGGAWRFGAALNYERATLNIPDRLSTAESDGYAAAAYGGLSAGSWALRFGGSYGNGTMHTTRRAMFGGFDETLVAEYGVHVGQVFGEVGYATSIRSVAIEPFAGLAHIAISTDAFTESGGDAALASDGEHHALTIASFGARFAAPLPIVDQAIRLTGLIAWDHAFGDVTPTSDLAFAGGSPFTVAGVPATRDRARLEVGLDWQMSPRAKLALGYSGQFASGVSENAVKATFSLHF